LILSGGDARCIRQLVKQSGGETLSRHKKQRMKVLAFGEILWDIINGIEHLGGAPFNFAAHAAQCGNESYMISRLGKDALGKRAFQLSKEYGVDTTFIQWDDLFPTGTVDVTLTNGQPDYFIREQVAYDHISARDIVTSLKDLQFDVFYFGSLSQRSPVSAEALFAILSSNRFKHIFYDVNLRKNGFTENVIRKSLAACTIFKLNSDEVNVISKLLWDSVLPVEQFCFSLKSRFPNINLVVVTASEKGCYVFEDHLITVPGTLVEVSDAVGAGDAFSAAFMHVYASTGDAFKAAQVANKVGAFVATKHGAIPVYSTAIAAMLKLNHGRVAAGEDVV
jgi:fructokinase